MEQDVSNDISGGSHLKTVHKPNSKEKGYECKQKLSLPYSPQRPIGSLSTKAVSYPEFFQYIWDKGIHFNIYIVWDIYTHCLSTVRKKIKTVYKLKCYVNHNDNHNATDHLRFFLSQYKLADKMLKLQQHTFTNRFLQVKRFEQLSETF